MLAAIDRAHAAFGNFLEQVVIADRLQGRICAIGHHPEGLRMMRRLPVRPERCLQLYVAVRVQAGSSSRIAASRVARFASTLPPARAAAANPALVRAIFLWHSLDGSFTIIK